MKNRNCKIVVSKKEYKCECCNKKINIGDKYLRLNINRKGIFHFCKECEKNNMGGIMQIIKEDELEYIEEKGSVYGNPTFYDDEGNDITEDFGYNEF